MKIFKSLSLSFLVCLLGAVLFGFVYGLGYYIIWLSAIEIMFASTVYLKFSKENAGAKRIIVSLIWCTLWVFALNFVSVIICEAIWFANEFNCSFADGFNLLFDSWKSIEDVKTYINSRILQIAGMSVLGCGITAIFYVSNNAKNKKLAKEKETQPTNAEIIYSNLTLSCKPVVEEYLKTKNSETFKEKIKNLRLSYAKDLKDEKIVEELKIIIEKELKNESLNKIDKLTISTLSKIIK